METILISAIGLLVSVMLALFGFVFRRMNEMDSRLRQAPDREEVRELVADKLEPTQVMQRELKEDIKDIKRSLEKLLNKK